MKKLLVAVLSVVAVAIDLTGPASSASPTAAALSISPDVGRPRIPITAHGRGFLAGETVDLSFDGAPIGKARTEPDGTFTTRVRVPSSALPGGHEVLAVGETSGLSASDTYLVQTDWARFSFDGANRWNRFENVLGPDNVRQLTTIWRQHVCGKCGLALAGGLLYMADSNNSNLTTVSAFDASTGAVVWSVELQGDVTLDPIVADGQVLMSFEDGSVVSLDAATGASVWSVALGRPNYLGVLAADAGHVYVPLDDGRLVALRLLDGTTAWTADVSTGHASGAAVWKGVVYVAGYLVTEALDAATGATIWSAPADCTGYCQAVVYSSGLVFTGAMEGGQFSALDASTGEKVWSVTPDGAYSMENAPTAANGILYLPSGDLGRFIAMDARTGETLWHRYLADFSASSPAVANGVVYIGSDNGSLLAIDVVTRRTLWVKDDLYIGYSPPIVADGRLYVTGGGYLWAFGLPEG